MKLYCHCSLCRNKVYLKSEAKTRYQLSVAWGRIFEIGCPYCRQQVQIDVNHVWVEPTKSQVPIAMTLGGGLVGVLAGPLGIIIGLAVGGASGGAISYNEKQAVNNFNNNYI